MEVIKHLVDNFNHCKIKFLQESLFLNLTLCFVIFVVSPRLLFSGIVAYIYNVCCCQMNLTLSPYLHVISYKLSSYKFESRIDLLA